MFQADTAIIFSDKGNDAGRRQITAPSPIGLFSFLSIAKFFASFNPHCSFHPVSFSKSKFRLASGSILSTTDFLRMKGAGSNLSAL